MKDVYGDRLRRGELEDEVIVLVSFPADLDLPATVRLQRTSIGLHRGYPSCRKGRSAMRWSQRSGMKDIYGDQLRRDEIDDEVCLLMSFLQAWSYLRQWCYE